MESNSEGNEIQAAKLNENDDKLNKFKALAVKLKKELNEVKDQVSFIAFMIKLVAYLIILSFIL